MRIPLTLIPIGILGALFAYLATRLGKALAGRPKPLRPHFKRLGQYAPFHPCPCAKHGQTYEQCCRSNDVEKLEMDVRTYIFNDWMRRSGGRSRARSMKLRLEDYPIAEVTLPEWVAAPEKFKFPIDENILRSWSPFPKTKDQPAAESFDDLPI